MTRHCPQCAADVVGQWSTCPLCHTPLTGEQAANTTSEPYPAVPLWFDRRRLQTVLMALSLLAVGGSFAAQLLLPEQMGPERTVWLALATLWLVVFAAAYRRRNIGSLVAWLVLLLSVAALAWDLVTGGLSWATTWAIPAICTSANVALGVVTWFVRTEPGEHIAKVALVLGFGLVPGLFVVFGWVTLAWPALVCVGLSLVLLTLLTIVRRRELGDSLHRRLQV